MEKNLRFFDASKLEEFYRQSHEQQAKKKSSNEDYVSTIPATKSTTNLDLSSIFIDEDDPMQYMDDDGNHNDDPKEEQKQYEEEKCIQLKQLIENYRKHIKEVEQMNKK